MPEAIDALNTEIPYSAETPRDIKIVALPNIVAGGRTMRLGMHTDSILTLLKTLKDLPDLDQLKIDGRVLTPKQKELLNNDPIYQFYISGRMVRALGRQEDIFLLPKGINLDSEKVASLLQTPFTPAVLSDKIGYETGYFSAESLVSQWQSSGYLNNFLLVMGGTNEFNIGSDTLSDERLSQIAEKLRQAFIEQESSTPNVTFKQQIINSFSHYGIGSLNLARSAPLLDAQPVRKYSGQVKKLSEIVVGELYTEMHDNQNLGTIKVVEAPHQDSNGGWWIKVEKNSDGRTYTKEISLADRGIVPYNTNKWNPINLLVKGDLKAKTGN